MSEGTKLGEYRETSEFGTAVEVSIEPTVEVSGELRATKLGELSEFEKSLFLEAVHVQKSTTKKSETPAPQVSIEISSVLDAGKSADFSDEINRLVVNFNEGDVIKGMVRNVEKSGVLVDIGYKSDGFISNIEFSNDPEVTAFSMGLKPGDQVEAYIEKLESKEGYTILSRKRAEYEKAWNNIAQLVKSRETIDIKVTSKVEGGLVASYMGIKGFIPASQVLKDGETDLSPFLNQVLEVGILQADRKRRKVVFAQKTSRGRSQKEAIAKALETLEIGQVKSGKVTSIKDFGAFVELGGVEGLVHISEMSWVRVSHPSQLVKLGDVVNVFVLGIDKEGGKVSLGMKQLEQDPWVTVAEKYRVDQIIEGTVTRIVTFGAFVKIEDNLEGLIHISELSNRRVGRVEDVINVGDQVTARIIKMNPAEQKIGLSLKQVERAESKVNLTEAQ